MPDKIMLRPENHKYVFRLRPTVHASTKSRHCRACNELILSGEKHITIDGHLSSGYRSDTHICHA
jgi:hypothetical protein